jgi:dGTPase
VLVQGNVFSIEDSEKNLMETLITNNLWRYKKTKIVSDFFVPFRVALNTRSVQHASDQFIQNIKAVFHGSYNQALMEDKSSSHALLETLKSVAFKYVFCAKEVQKQELQGYRIISGLLDIYKPLLNLDRVTFTAIVDKQKGTPLYQSRLFDKLSSKHLAAYELAIENLTSFKQQFDGTSLELVSDNAWEFYFRCRLIQDYISGMTDQFAYDEYRALHVIEN